MLCLCYWYFSGAGDAALFLRLTIVSILGELLENLGFLAYNCVKRHEINFCIFQPAFFMSA
ncbi:hypothetical protein NSMM_370066 [Nitrosomonas mobilis]|uniref:Uncharacterized protein n=1 Tax=Nitrosomonas mobilis TaxID=51642 RepID=A0A1G5SE74_9PROT|nr:hypothetical protein NSMM_370066 [Nitrosomonas mobilis]